MPHLASIVHILILTLAASMPSPARTEGIQLLSDTEFQNGFVLSAASSSARPLEIGELTVAATGNEGLNNRANWRLAQWGTNQLLVPGQWTGTAMNPAKTVAWKDSDGGPGSLLLEVRADVETGGQLRRQGEAWPHLLIEQKFSPTIELDDWSSLEFNLRFRVLHAIARSATGASLDSGLHTAQVSAYWTLERAAEKEGQEADRLWFGLPIFDARYPIPIGNQAPDQGQPDASGLFIFVPEGDRFYASPTGNGEWHNLKVDIVPLLAEAAETAYQAGHWKRGDVSQCQLTSFNLGWEVPGPFDASIELSEISFKGIQNLPPP